MENITLIKTIEAYLQKKMTVEEVMAFEQQMANDPILQELVSQYKETFKVLQQQWLSMQVKAAAKSLYWMKLLKLFGLTVVGIIVTWFLLHTMSSESPKTASKMVAPIEANTTPAPRTNAPIDTTKADLNQTQEIAVKQAPTQKLNTTIPEQIKVEPKPTDIEKQEISTENVATKSPEKLSLEAILKNYRSTLHPDTQYFTITNNRDTTLYGVQGTSIFFPANSLINFKSKVPVKGEIEIKLCEFTDYYSLYQGNISTLCDSQLLQSGGACYLEAHEQSDSVFVKQGAHLKLGFECTNIDYAMSTFYGNRDSNDVVVWQTANKINVEKSDISVNKKSTKKSRDRRPWFKIGPFHWIGYLWEVMNLPSWSKNNSKNSGGVAWEGKPEVRIQNTIVVDKFGYINCDHFMGRNNLEKVKITATDTVLESFMFFKSIKSCMKSYANVFNNIPHGSNVLILTIYTRNNELFMSFKYTTTSKEIYMNEIIPMNRDQIKSELDKFLEN